MNLIQFWFDYVSADLTHQVSAQLHTPALRDSVFTSLRFLVIASGWHPTILHYGWEICDHFQVPTTAYCDLCALGASALACGQFWDFPFFGGGIWPQYLSFGNMFSGVRRGRSTIIMRCAEPRLADSRYLTFSGSTVHVNDDSSST